MPAILLALTLAFQQPSAAVIDRIMAVVGGQPVMLSDVTAASTFQLVEVPAGTADPTQYILGRLIRRTLVLAEVDRFQPPQPDDTEITARIDDLARRAGSPEAFQRELAVTGMTREQLQRYIRDDLRIRSYLLERFGANRPEAEFNAAVDAWVLELRRRAQITVLYQGKT